MALRSTAGLGKLKRVVTFVGENVLVDALYGGKTSQYIETPVKFEDGRSGMVSADLKIEDAKTFAVVGKAA